MDPILSRGVIAIEEMVPARSHEFSESKISIYSSVRKFMKEMRISLANSDSSPIDNHIPEVYKPFLMNFYTLVGEYCPPHLDLNDLEQDLKEELDALERQEDTLPDNLN